VVLDSLCPTRPGAVHDIGGALFWEELERELEAEPAQWWPEATGSARRSLRDRRGEAFAALAGDLLSSGEEVLLVVADLERRRVALEATVAGGAAEGLAALTWTALGAEPRLAHRHAHLVALDPPPVGAGVDLLAAASGEGFAHLAWGPGECAFAREYWRSELDLRPALAEVWRALSTAGPVEGEDLAELLRGTGSYPRRGALCARLVRVLEELGLASFDRTTRRCAVRPGPRTQLDSSPAYRAYAIRLQAAECHLAAEQAGSSEPALARAG